MTPEEAQAHLASIREVVDRAREERMQNSDIFVFWGVILVLCAVATLTGDALGWPWGWVSYPVACTLGGIWTGWVAFKRGLTRDTYGGRIEGALWGAVGLAMTVFLFGGLTSEVLPLEAVTPAISCLAGVALTTSGTVFKTPLLTYSGLAFILLSGPCFFLTWQAQYAVFAVALVFGYIIPGLILMRRERATG